nr:1-aminocyclopropane-1-carboxylate oxidase homolog 3-like [Tanacetum cinerariifolium]
MRIDELHKFSDGTLNDVRTALDDHLKGIRMKYLPQAIWRKSDKERATAMIQAIDKQLKTRRIKRSLEKLVGGRFGIVTHWFTLIVLSALRRSDNENMLSLAILILSDKVLKLNIFKKYASISSQDIKSRKVLHQLFMNLEKLKNDGDSLVSENSNEVENYRRIYKAYTKEASWERSKNFSFSIHLGYEELYEQTTKFKMKFYNREVEKGVTYSTNLGLYQSKAVSWRDTIQMSSTTPPNQGENRGDNARFLVYAYSDMDSSSEEGSTMG